VIKLIAFLKRSMSVRSVLGFIYPFSFSFLGATTLVVLEIVLASSSKKMWNPMYVCLHPHPYAPSPFMSG
jgi:hypothetical protein